jgi:hypothetical protein
VAHSHAASKSLGCRVSHTSVVWPPCQSCHSGHMTRHILQEHHGEPWGWAACPFTIPTMAAALLRRDGVEARELVTAHISVDIATRPSYTRATLVSLGVPHRLFQVLAHRGGSPMLQASMPLVLTPPAMTHTHLPEHSRFLVRPQRPTRR